MGLNADNIAAYFGADASDVFETKETAEGYLAGTAVAARITAGAMEDLSDKSREYREAFFRALQENL